MASGRLPEDRSLNATTRTLARLRGEGIEVLDLTLSNPTCAGFNYPAALLEPLGSATSLHYDPQPLGTLHARAAIADDLVRRGLQVSPSRIALSASTSEAYAWLFKLLCDPGDEVLVPRPSYPLFEHLTQLEGVKATTYALDAGDQWRIDFASLEHGLSERTRAVLVVSPNNPTGHFVHADDLARLDALCADGNLVLLGDEVFADYPLEGTGPSVLSLERAVVCSLGGLSKSVGLPQLKLAWTIFGGPTSKVNELLSAFELIADTYLSVATPVQTALPDLLARGAVIRDEIRARLVDNLARLRCLAAVEPAVTVLGVEGGWSAVLRVPRFRSEESLVLDLLTTDHVLVHPGFFFDFDREAYLVVSLLPPPDAFERGVQRVMARAARPTLFA